MTQKAIYPMRYLRITQDEYGTYSHKGSRAHDNGGQSSATDNALFAPYDGTAARVRQDSSHETYFVSDSPVQTPNHGVCVLTTTLMHDNVLDVHTGKKAKQGEKIGDEGGFGYGRKDAFAHHAHIEVSKGRQTTQAKNQYGVYCTPGALSLHDAFYLHPDTMVYTRANGAMQWKRAGDFPGGKAQDSCGHTWAVATELDKPARPDAPAVDTTKPLQLTVTEANCEYFTARDVDRPAGKLGKDKVYDVLEYYPEEVVIGTLRGHWVRFAAVDGAEYYTLALPDRTRLANVWTPAVGDTVRATTVLNARTAPGTSRALLATIAAGSTGDILDIDGGSCYIAGKGWVVLAGVELVERAV